jgi:hypothetical protein
MSTYAEVTRNELVLDAQNATSGWFDYHYNDSIIDMAIQPKGTAVNGNLEAGKYIKYDLVGYTAETVKEGDRVTDKLGNVFSVVTVEPFTNGDTVEYYTVSMDKVQNNNLFSFAYTSATLGSAIHQTKIWLDAYLTAANLPAFITAYAFPVAYPLTRVFNDQAIDIIFSFSNPTSTPIYQGDKSIYGYEENVPITISAVDKDVSGVTLIWQAETELRRLCETYPFGSLRLMNNNRDKTTRSGSFVVSSSEFTVIYRRTK